MRDQDSIWITGAGAICSIGTSPQEIGDHLLAGKSGIKAITRFPVTDHPSQMAACLEHVPTPADWDAADFAQRTPWHQILIWCARQALGEAGIWERRGELRIGVVLGIGAEWIVNWEQDLLRGGRRLYDPNCDSLGLGGEIQTTLGLGGPTVIVGAACASANIALGVARQWLRKGWVDYCLAGGAECSVTPGGLAGFGNLGALSKRNQAPQFASRPFDRGRDGFVMGEGGVLFTLETERQARRRGVVPRAELAGFGASSDAHHLVIPSNDPVPASRAIESALADARLAPQEVNYINAHATSTPIGDIFEAKALQLVFKEELANVPISSTKSMTGHMLSAASGIEALACLTSIERGALPPTINLDDLDPECAMLNHVPNQAREHRVDVAISNSFGFGGANTCAVFRRAA
ncbi:MAG: beta-ketoacyl-[acyl-carrier-protein] synthase family protein [Planctomycetota bacterium]